MDYLTGLVARLVTVLKRLGGAALIGMMLLTCLDVLTRFFGRPILGAVEVVSFMATVLLACAMPTTHVEQGHVGVDLIVRKLSPKSQALVDGLTGLLAGGLFLIVSWQTFLYGLSLKRSGEVSMTLQFPSYVFVYVVGVAFLVLALVILLDVVKNFSRAGRS